jgi:regulation of enolase protein 1 (concanavalin A-like superfamily)
MVHPHSKRRAGKFKQVIMIYHIYSFENAVWLLLFLGVGLTACKGQKAPDISDKKETGYEQMEENLLLQLTMEDLDGFQWLNPPTTYQLKDGVLQITAPEGSDYFNNPEDQSRTGTAPFLYQQVKGDFVAVAHLQPDFSDQWNAMALMVYIDSTNWIKFAFENSDATGTGIVSVVTRGVSDDANGVILNTDKRIWLKLIRKGDLYSMLWSRDGDTYRMARISAMKQMDSVRFGIEAQCPVGKSAVHVCDYFSIVLKTVEDLRKGI